MKSFRYGRPPPTNNKTSGSQQCKNDARGFRHCSHQGKIGDRFVGIEFDYTGGRVITEPLVFEGNRLVLNVDAGGMGEGRVGIIRADGTRLPGYDVEDCDIINGDWFDKTISWKKGNKDVAVLAGQPIRLVFEMRHARLFAMQFQRRDEPNTPGWEAHP